MKMKFQIIGKVLLLVTLCTNYYNILLAQDSIQDTIPAEIIKLERGCKLVIDANIDLSDTISIEIVDGISNIVSQIQKLIPTDSVTINLAISSEYILPDWGIGARTIGDDNGESVELYFDPNHQNFKVELIIRTLVHELHHVGRVRLPEFQLTLLECMVNEGLADHFMVEILKCEQPPWSSALTEDQIQQNIDRVTPFLFTQFESWTTEFDEEYFNKWMLGSNGSDSIPHWTGYSIGWRIVENYLKEYPGETAASLVWTHAEIITGSTPDLLIDNEKK